MLLAVDVGNTSIAVGVFKGKRLAATWRLSTNARAAPHELGRSLFKEAKLRGVMVDAAVFGSVVPMLDIPVADGIDRAFGVRALQIGPESSLGLRLKVKTPKEVGADRILDALAAKEIYGLPAIVIDMGTATTFECVSLKGEYLGGAILPGLRMMAQALHEKTAKLPLVEIQKPQRAIGKDTMECMQAGLYLGYLGMIEKLLNLSLSEMRVKRSQTAIIATGGLSVLFRKDFPKRVIWAPDLTLQGLRLAWEKSR